MIESCDQLVDDLLTKSHCY